MQHPASPAVARPSCQTLGGSRRPLQLEMHYRFCRHRSRLLHRPAEPPSACTLHTQRHPRVRVRTEVGVLHRPAEPPSLLQSACTTQGKAILLRVRTQLQQRAVSSSSLHQRPARHTPDCPSQKVGAAASKVTTAQLRVQRQRHIGIPPSQAACATGRCCPFCSLRVGLQSNSNCHCLHHRTCRLTLQSTGRPQAGFAHLRPPVTSNVRPHRILAFAKADQSIRQC